MPKFKFWGYIDVRIDCETVVEAENEEEAGEIAEERFDSREDIEEQNDNEEVVEAQIVRSEALED